MIWAKVTHQFAGVHHWPAAYGKHDYLKHPHRHLFHVTVWIQQFHDNRDVEYMLFKDWLGEVCTNGKLDYKSCEMIAGEIAGRARAEWPGGAERRIKVEVTEDGENGALIEA